jgi:hypothetical protein
MARDCVKRIVEQSNGLFTEAEAKRLLKEVDDFARSSFNKSIDKSEAVQQQLELRLKNAKRGLQLEKQNAARNVLLRKELLDKAKSFVDAGVEFGDLKFAMMTGINKRASQGRLSFEQSTITARNRVLGGLMADLDKNKLLDVVASDRFDVDIETELYNFNANKEGRPVTGNKEAYAAAKIIREHQEALRKQLNYYGADIGKLEHYSAYRTHDPVKMKKLGEDKWVEFVKDGLDLSKSFGGDVAPTDIDRVLRDTYNALVTGIRFDQGERSKNLFHLSGPGNLAKRLSHSRQLIFRDANVEISYRKTYGRSASFKENVFAGFENAAVNMASLKTWGTNPEAMIEKIFDDVGKNLRSKKVKSKKGENNYISNFESEKNKALDLYRDIRGEFSNPDSIKLAQFGAVVRTFQNFKLGAATIASAFGDTFTKALAYNYNGRNVISSYAKALTDLRSAFDTEGQKRFSTMLSVAADSYRGDLAGRFTLEENLSSTAQRINRAYFRLNLLTWWTRQSEVAFARSLSADLAYHKGRSFTAIPNHDILKTYGIDDAEWKVFQDVVENVDGTDFVNPRAVRHLPDAVINEYKAATKSNKSLTALREDLQSKLEIYFNDQASFAIPRGGARERQIWLSNTKAGTVEGEFRRFIAQFKQQPTVIATKIWGRAIYGGKNGADIGSIMQLMLLAPVFGYLQSAAKDLLKGKEPKDPMQPATIVDAFSRGGGLSIMGETILNFANDDPVRTLVGLAGPSVDDALNLIYVAAGDSGKRKKALQDLVDSATPNLFYTNAAVQYMFAHHVKETLNPGYLNRAEKNMKKFYNQEYYLRPK